MGCMGGSAGAPLTIKTGTEERHRGNMNNYHAKQTSDMLHTATGIVYIHIHAYTFYRTPTLRGDVKHQALLTLPYSGFGAWAHVDKPRAPSWAIRNSSCIWSTCPGLK